MNFATMTKGELRAALDARKSIIAAFNAKTDSATAEDIASAQTAMDEAKNIKAELDKRQQVEAEAKAAADTLAQFTSQPVNAFQHNPASQPASSEKSIVVPATVRKANPRYLKSAESAYGLGQFIRATIGNNGKAAQWCNEHGIPILKAQAENDNIAGGFLVPPQFDTEIIDLRESYGVIRRNAKRAPMVGDTLTIPRRTGGLTAYFVNDNAAISDSTKNWDIVTLTAKKVGVLTKISSELAEDAIINVADDLANEIAYAFAQLEDNCAFNGDGSDTYGGIVGFGTKFINLGTVANTAGLVTGTAGTGWQAMVYTDFTNCKGLLPQYADKVNHLIDGVGPKIVSRDVKWYCHKTFYDQVMLKAALAAGGVTEKEVFESYSKPMFLGYDVEFVQSMPSYYVAGQIPVLFGNLSLAADFGDRRQTTIAMSNDVYFANDQLAIRGTERFDINVHDIGNNSATASLRKAGPVVGVYMA